MWQRFTERARQAIFSAQEEASRFGPGFVSTEHLLLGLVRGSESNACLILSDLNVDCDEIVRRIESQIAAKTYDVESGLTLTPMAKRAIDFSYDEARLLKSNFIGTEHILLGLIRDRGGLAGRVLSSLDVRLETVREAVEKNHQERGISRASVLPENLKFFLPTILPSKRNQEKNLAKRYPNLVELVRLLIGNDDEALRTKLIGIMRNREAIRREATRWLAAG